MKKFSKKIGVLTLGISLIAGVGVALFSTSKNINKVDATPEIGTTYTIVKSNNELVEGANYTILGSPDLKKFDVLSTIVQQYDYMTGIRIASYSTQQTSYPTTFVSTKTETEEVMNLKLVKYTENEQVKWAFKTTNYYGTNGYLCGGTNKLSISDTPYSVTFSIDSGSASPWADINVKGSDGTDLKIRSVGTTPGRFRCSNTDNGICLYKAATTAKDWADDFLATTATPCAESTQDHKEALEAVWNSTVTKYNLLSDADKEILKSAKSATENVGAAIERYDTIIKKYAGSSSIISNYIDRTISSSNKTIMGFDTTTIIISVIALTGVSIAAVYLFAKKLKHK